jgi:hypothetical protein
MTITRSRALYLSWELLLISSIASAQTYFFGIVGYGQTGLTRVLLPSPLFVEVY